MSNALEYAMNKAKSFKTRREFLDYLATILPKLDTEQAKIAASFIEDEVIKESRTNYYQYVKLMGPVLMGEFVDGRHIEIIANKLQRAAERAMKKGTKRYKLKLNMPPGASKTQLCSRMFGSWVIGRWPWAKLLICTHGLVFGRDEIGMKMLDIMRTDEYRKIFPEVELREDKQTAGRFLTTDDGEMLITSLSAGTSGRRGHIILADDAVIESDALSKDIRTKRNSEYTTNIRTRFQPGYNCAEIVIGCLTADSQILLADNTVKKITDILAGDKVQTYSKEGKMEVKTVKSLVPQGKDSTYILKTKNCLSIRGNYRHPFLLASGEWKPMGELQPGDKIQYRRAQVDNEVCGIDVIEEYWLLGFMFGDGWINTTRRGDGRERYATQLAVGVHEDLNTKIQGIFTRVFGGKWKLAKISRTFRTERREVAEWFISRGLTGECRAHTKRIPTYVYTLPFQLREAFLDGILDADGSIVKTGGRSIEMCNRALISDIKRLAELQGFTCGQVRERTRTIKPPSRAVASEYTMYSISLSGVRETCPFGTTEVITCEKTGVEEEVYDLMVEGNHNFIANGMVVHNTQWAQGDLFDYVEDADKHSTDKWDIIKFPALLTDEASEKIRKKDDPVDAYLPGTSYWPEMYTTEQLENVRASMRNDMARWNALYMQSPTPESGAIFNAEDFRVWRDTIPPPVHTKLLVLDTAYTKGKQSDPSAYSLFGIFNRTEGGQTRPNIILLDANKGKWDFPELLRKIETLYSRKKPEYIVIEKQSSGLALIPELRNRGLPIVEWRTQKDKIARAHSVSPLVKSGIFWVPMPDGDDNTAQKSMDYISTICAMSSWDLLDTFTSGLMYMRDENLLIGDNYTTTEDEFYYEEDEDDYETRGSYVGALMV